MKFTIIWTPKAVRAALKIWRRASDQTALSRALDEITVQLTENDPRTVGESREDHQRVTYASPLAVRYEVILDDYQVRIVAVWQIKPV